MFGTIRDGNEQRDEGMESYLSLGAHYLRLSDNVRAPQLNQANANASLDFRASIVNGLQLICPEINERSASASTREIATGIRGWLLLMDQIKKPIKY